LFWGTHRFSYPTSNISLSLAGSRRICFRAPIFPLNARSLRVRVIASRTADCALDSPHIPPDPHKSRGARIAYVRHGAVGPRVPILSLKPFILRRQLRSSPAIPALCIRLASMAWHHPRHSVHTYTYSAIPMTRAHAIRQPLCSTLHATAVLPRTCAATSSREYAPVPRSIEYKCRCAQRRLRKVPMSSSPTAT
jgi:hypothetical protein